MTICLCRTSVHEQGHQHIPEPRWLFRHTSLRCADNEQLHVGLPSVRYSCVLRLVCVRTAGEPQQLQARQLQRLYREWGQAPPARRDSTLHVCQFLHVSSQTQVCQFLQMNPLSFPPTVFFINWPHESICTTSSDNLLRLGCSILELVEITN